MSEISVTGRAQSLLRALDDRMLANDRAGALVTALEAVRTGELTIPHLYALVLAPLMRLTGERWQRGDEAVWQEHYTTGVVRTIVEALAPTVAELRGRAPRAGRTVVLACPEEEYHDLGLRMLFDRLLLAGYEAHYLGANVPEAEVVRAASALGADAVFLSASTHYHRVRLRAYAEALQAACQGITVWVGGPAFVCGADGWSAEEILDADELLNDLGEGVAAPEEECE